MWNLIIGIIFQTSREAALRWRWLRELRQYLLGAACKMRNILHGSSHFHGSPLSLEARRGEGGKYYYIFYDP